VFAHPQVSAKDRRAARLCNLHGWCGVLPLLVFLVLHVLLNAFVLFAPTRFIAFQSWRGAAWIELVGVWLPLGLHALYGTWLAVSGAQGRANRPEMATLLTRASGFATLAFIAYHALDFRVPYLSGELDGADVAQKLYAELSATTADGIPLTGALYLLGLGVTVFHAAYGAYWMYAGAHPAADLARAGRWIGGFATLLFVAGAQTTVYCATGSRFFFW
jgi:succinate dehydrogenase / fumarate reductase cytochrome b subunit